MNDPDPVQSPVGRARGGSTDLDQTEMTDSAFAPLAISCPSCGMPAEDFDIISQEYRCRHCGGSVSAHDARVKFETWAQEHAFQTARGVAQISDGGIFSCPSCGAEAKISPKGASDELATAKRDHCGAQFVAAPPGKTFTSPDVMIPFFITLDEAKTRLRDRCDRNAGRREARAVRERVDNLRGLYLPYEIVKGPIRFSVSRDSSDRDYTCGGCLEGTAVSTSKAQDNLTLDAMEPFDWSGARDRDGMSCVEFSGIFGLDDEDRHVLMLFDVSEYARGGEMEMRLAEMSFLDTKEIVSDDLAERIMRAPFEYRE